MGFQNPVLTALCLELNPAHTHRHPVVLSLADFPTLTICAVHRLSTHTYLLAAIDTVTQNIINGPISGIMGLGFQALSQFQNAPVWQNLVSSNKVPSPEFSFFVARQEQNANANDATNPGGTFTLGGTNSSLFTGDIDFQSFPANSVPSFWLQTVSAVTLNGQSVSIGSASSNVAAIDTGTTLIGGPQAAVQAFYSQIPGAQPVSNGMFAFRASRFPCLPPLV
jgi:cathepsin D